MISSLIHNISHLFTTVPPQACFDCLTVHNMTNSQLALFDSSVGIVEIVLYKSYDFFFKKIEGLFFFSGSILTAA